MMALAKHVRRRLRELRQARGFTQARLAELASITVDAVNRIERGNRSPGLETLERLAIALGVDVVHLVDRQNPLPKASHSPAVARVVALLNEKSDGYAEAALVMLRAFNHASALTKPTDRRPKEQ